LAATATGAIISNCNVSGILSVANSTTSSVGGLIGKSFGSNNVNMAFMNYTLSNTLSPKSEWIEQAIPISGNMINCELVPDCKFWFLSVEDEAKNRMSSEIYSN
jgi:hypothetical protein